MAARLKGIAVAFALLLAVGVAFGYDADIERPGHYIQGEVIPLFVDTVAPYHNPQESYRYYSLKYCQPEPLHHKAQSFGEVLQGSEKAYSPYKIEFKKSTPERGLCEADWRAEDIRAFQRAVEEQYQYHLYFDDIPIKNSVGEFDDGAYWVFTEHDFYFEYNHDRVITANVTTRDSNKRIKLPVDESGNVDDDATLKVKFSYSVMWTATTVTWEDRPANNPAEVQEEEIEIQWFSIVNSTVLVILVTGFLAFILMRILKKDVQHRLDAKDVEEEDESGWKQLYKDVFRPPQYACLFASIVGTGMQILLLFVIMLTLAVLGVFSQHGRGTMYAAILVVYSLAAGVAGYASAALYTKLGGTNWVNNVLCTVGLFAVPAFVIWAILNTVAIAYSSTVALPFGTIIALFAFYFFVTFPFTLAGAIAGKNYGGSHDPTAKVDKHKTSQVPRQIPDAPWYRQSIAYIVVAGFLPFSAIYVELYYVFISLWGHQLLTPYGILYLVFVILLMVTVCITIALTYLQFTMENWKWWWFSIFSGGATAFFIYAYCFYFLLSESKMSGFMQVSYYFGYMGLICYALFLMLGSVGFYGTMWFVDYIYSSIKAE